MYENQQLWIAQAETPEKERICLLPSMANRHGLITGTTGTGKTVTLKVLAETFADAGVPVFLADMKGDVSGIIEPGTDSPKMQQFIADYGFSNFTYRGYSTAFWDVFGENGIPLRTTISEMGPTLLARLLELNQTQEDILNIIFRIADDSQLLLLDIKDLRQMINYVSEHRQDFSSQYGSMSPQSLGAVSRALTALESEGAGIFFGEPALDIRDWMRRDVNSRGIINVLDATRLIQSPRLYAAFMLWMLSELYETMPEAGDQALPKMIFIFDEAHLLFHDAPKVLLEKVTQIMKLIRSKGIGIYFCSQSPSDIPDEILSQIGNRIQHALRAYTPADQKTVKAASQSFRPNPSFRTEDVITELGTGEALVSFLDEDGAPQIVQRAHILCPQSLMAAASPQSRRACIQSSDLLIKYGQPIDRESAYELLTKRLKEEEEAEKRAREEERRQKEQEKEEKEREKEKAARERAKSRRQSPLQKGINSAMSTFGREVTRSLVRGLLNNLKK